MPELPEVETVVRKLRPRIVGKTIIDSKIHSPWFLESWNQSPAEFLEDTQGSKITDIYRRGKYIIVPLLRKDEKERYLVVHLGMVGALVNVRTLEGIPPKISNHIHILFELSDESLLFYSDYRHIGSILTYTPWEFEHHRSITFLGPEPFEKGVEETVVKNLRKIYQTRKSSVKQAFLDQEIIAGIGNIYICEGLYRAGIQPLT